MKNKYIMLITLFLIQVTGYSQVTVSLSICGSNTFSLIGTDATGRNIYQDGSGGFNVQWSAASNEWQIVQLPSSVGYSNSFASTPNPPCTSTGVWSVVTPGCGSVTGVTGDCQTTITGMENLVAGNEITVFPNPGNGQFHFSGLGKENSIHVFDVTGRLILQTNLSGNWNSIDLSGKEKGVYWYRVMEGNSIVKQGKITLI